MLWQAKRHTNISEMLISSFWNIAINIFGISYLYVATMVLVYPGEARSSTYL